MSTDINLEVDSLIDIEPVSTIKDPGATSRTSGNPASTIAWRIIRYSVGFTAEVRTYTLLPFGRPGTTGGNDVGGTREEPGEEEGEGESPSWAKAGATVASRARATNKATSTLAERRRDMVPDCPPNKPGANEAGAGR